MQKPVLVIMAAGLGSRYGGLKQMSPIDDTGHLIIDYSIFDAKRAGFETVICVIAPWMENDFNERMGNRVSGHVDLKLVHQTLAMLPPGFSVPKGREKPWGTAHAVLCAGKYTTGPFAVINADDFYGAEAFKQVYHFLTEHAGPDTHAMVGYAIENTLTENGYVSRGVCLTEGEQLLEIHERVHIEKRPGGAAYTENGKQYHFIPAGTIVSMNLWGFGAGIMTEIENRFIDFLNNNMPKNPLKCEYFLPAVPNQLLHEQKAKVWVLRTTEKWMGVTYPEDMPVVRDEIKQMKASGKYPNNLWGHEV